MKEKVYEGMNPKYYMGLQSFSSWRPEDLQEWDKRFQGSSSPHSGSSSNTAKVLPIQEEGAGGAHNPVAAQQDNIAPLERPLPIRRRQRKPDRKGKTTIVQAAALPPLAPTHKRKQGRKPKGRGSRPKRIAKASKAGQAAGAKRKLKAKPPANSPEMQELPRRKAPKKMWPEEEATFVSRRARGHAQAEEEEDDTEDYSPSPSAMRRVRASVSNHPRQAWEGRPRHPKGEKKKGGPCAKCHVIRAVTWRRGAQGRAYAGQHLCNRCGVWESRHPDSEEEGLQRCVNGRRRAYRAQGVSRLDRANSSTQGDSNDLNSDTCKATAVDTAAEANPTRSTEVQQWQGNGNLVDRAPTAAQSSGLQFLAKQGCADTGADDSAGDSVCSGAAVVQGGQGGGAKMSRKRGAEASTAQPAGKRWKIESFPGSLPSSVGQQTSPCKTAYVAGFEGGSCSNEQGQGGSEVGDGRMVFLTEPIGLSFKSSAAMSQQYERRESGYV
ncbi:hypothetical protein ABBQ32_003940 [Trebouxia sp. C0010 RCD-2024]